MLVHFLRQMHEDSIDVELVRIVCMTEEVFLACC